MQRNADRERELQIAAAKYRSDDRNHVSFDKRAKENIRYDRFAVMQQSLLRLRARGRHSSRQGRTPRKCSVDHLLFTLTIVQHYLKADLLRNFCRLLIERPEVTALQKRGACQ